MAWGRRAETREQPNIAGRVAPRLAKHAVYVPACLDVAQFSTEPHSHAAQRCHGQVARRRKATHFFNNLCPGRGCNEKSGTPASFHGR